LGNRRSERIAACEAHRRPGRVWHSESVSDPLQYVDRGDLAARHNPADVAPVEADGCTELCLACAGFVGDEAEHCANVPCGQCPPYRLERPERFRHFHRFGRIAGSSSVVTRPVTLLYRG